MTATIAIQARTGPTPHIPVIPVTYHARIHMLGKENLGPSKERGSPHPIDNIRSRGERPRPCDACRKRKSRCVVHEGTVLCALCEFNKQECTFLEAPQPRKRRTESNEQKTVSVRKKPRSRSPVEPNHLQSVDPIQAANKVTHPKGLDLNSQLRTSLAFQDDTHLRYIGPTTPFEATLINLLRFDPHHKSGIGSTTFRRVSDQECFILSDGSTSNFSNDTEAIGLIEQIVHPHGPGLVNTYFRLVHPSFPVIQKKIFLEQYHSRSRHISPALLSAIYTLALSLWPKDGASANQRKPDSRKLESIAWKYFADALNRPALSTVQAGLVLLQRPSANCWSLTTRLVAIAQELGLHLDCSSWEIPSWERVLRRNMAWAVWVQDKWSSLIYGQPSHLFAANWGVPPLSEHDSQDFQSPYAVANDDGRGENTSVEEDQGRLLFREMIVLTGIMSEVLDTFYTQSAGRDFKQAEKSATRLILERAKPVQIKLKEWFANLPPSTRIDSLNEDGPSSNGALHLAYYATEVTLHRHILSSLPTTISSDTSPYLTQICRSAAKTRLISAMDFANRLKPHHLSAFWYFPSATNFSLIGTFGALLMATAPGREEAEFYRTRLGEYRWTLGVSVKRARWLEGAVEMLDLNAEMWSRLEEKPRIADVVINEEVSREREGVRNGEMRRKTVDGEDEMPSLMGFSSGVGLEGLRREMFDGYGSDEESESLDS